MSDKTPTTVPATIVTLKPEDYPCPACGATDRWDAIRTVESPDNNPELHIDCDCGAGSLVVIIA